MRALIQRNFSAIVVSDEDILSVIKDKKGLIDIELIVLLCGFLMLMEQKLKSDFQENGEPYLNHKGFGIEVIGI